MKIRLLRSGEGDCLLLSSARDSHMLIDGGIKGCYQNYWQRAMAQLRKNGEVLDLVCISHIDRDHIGGIMKMLETEVNWRVHEKLGDLPQHLKPRHRRTPKLARPPEIKAIWHNAFFEEVRRRVLSLNGNVHPLSHAHGFDVADTLFHSAAIIGGGGNAQAPQLSRSFQQLAANMQFLGQSVGDAIDISRRVSAEQLGIPLNPQFEGQFIVRSNQEFELNDFRIRVLGPSLEELEKLVSTWNTWLRKKQNQLKKLQKRHRRSADQLQHDTMIDIGATSLSCAIEFARNETVSAPNLASIVMLVSDSSDRSILLTGDADDVSILAGLKQAQLLNRDKPFEVDVFKVPHHGATNSYSDELARSVIARHYVFCGNGRHHNPELEVLDSYLTVLFEGKNGQPAALPAGKKIKFWFNCGPKLANKENRHEEHWKKIAGLLKKWDQTLGRRFSWHFFDAGDSVLVK